MTNNTSSFVVTLHAQRRYAERVLGDIKLISGVKKVIYDGIRAAVRLKEKTHKGELLYVNSDLDAVFIVKPDGYRLVIVSVLSNALFEELSEQRRREIELASEAVNIPTRKSNNKLIHIEQLQTSIESLKAKNAILREEVLRLSQELAEFRKAERQVTRLGKP